MTLDLPNDLAQPLAKPLVLERAKDLSSTQYADHYSHRSHSSHSSHRCACAAAWAGCSARTASPHNRRAANIAVIAQLSLVSTKTQVGVGVSTH